MSITTARVELHQLVDTLEDAAVTEALDYMRWLASDEEEELTPEELAEAQLGFEEIARGEYITLDDLRRSLAK